MAVIITWIKTYTSANDGEVLTGHQVGDIQSAINSHDHTFATGSFLALSDAPNSYSGQALKLVRVNAGANALEFTTSGGGGGGSTASYTQTFVEADLTTSQIIISHNLGIREVLCQVYDNSFKLVFPDEITLNSTTALTLDLTSFGTIAGTWTVKVVA